MFNKSSALVKGIKSWKDAAFDLTTKADLLENDSRLGESFSSKKNKFFHHKVGFIQSKESIKKRQVR